MIVEAITEYIAEIMRYWLTFFVATFVIGFLSFFLFYKIVDGYKFREEAVKRGYAVFTQNNEFVWMNDVTTKTIIIYEKSK